MANFFKKPTKPASAAGPSGHQKGDQAKAATSDFDAKFHPFVLKKDASLAPINYFVEKRVMKPLRSPAPVTIINRDGREVIDLDAQEPPEIPAVARTTHGTF